MDLVELHRMMTHWKDRHDRGELPLRFSTYRAGRYTPRSYDLLEGLYKDEDAADAADSDDENEYRAMMNDDTEEGSLDGDMDDCDDVRGGGEEVDDYTADVSGHGEHSSGADVFCDGARAPWTTTSEEAFEDGDDSGDDSEDEHPLSARSSPLSLQEQVQNAAPSVATRVTLRRVFVMEAAQDPSYQQMVKLHLKDMVRTLLRPSPRSLTWHDRLSLPQFRCPSRWTGYRGHTRLPTFLPATTRINAHMRSFSRGFAIMPLQRHLRSRIATHSFFFVP